MDDAETPRVARARELALEAHGDQRYGSSPYHAHLDAVAELVKEHGEEAQVFATPVQIGAIAEAFGPRIADGVALLPMVMGARHRNSWWLDAGTRRS